jgi:hypothetical protein
MKTTYRFRGQQGFSTDPLTGDVSKRNQDYSPFLGQRLSSTSVETSPDGLSAYVVLPTPINAQIPGSCYVELYCQRWGAGTHCGWSIREGDTSVYYDGAPAKFPPGFYTCMTVTSRTVGPFGRDPNLRHAPGFRVIWRETFLDRRVCNYVRNYMQRFRSAPCVRYRALFCNSNFAFRCIQERCLGTSKRVSGAGARCLQCTLYEFVRTSRGCYQVCRHCEPKRCP